VGGAEVHDDRIALLIEAHVGRLQIVVDHVAAVEKRQLVAEADGPADKGLLVRLLRRFQHRFQVRAGNEIRHQVGVAFVLERIPEARNELVIADAADHVPLGGVNAGQLSNLAGPLRREVLLDEADLALLVGSLVCGSEGSLAEESVDLVALFSRQPLARGEEVPFAGPHSLRH
jgi:hypothetical protein